MISKGDRGIGNQLENNSFSQVALVGPEIEENLSLRYIAASLQQKEYGSTIWAFNDKTDSFK